MNQARDGLALRRIWTMSADGDDQHALTIGGDAREEQPDWSSDGTTILFAGIGHEGVTASLWTVSSRGGDPTLVVEGLALPPSPARAELWFGYYGHVDWELLYDWWQPPLGSEER